MTRAIALFLAAALACSCALGCAAAPTASTSVEPVDLPVVPGAPDTQASAPAAGHRSLDVERTNLGLHATSSDQIRELAATPPIIGWFENWHAGLDTKKLALATERGAIPLITWQPTDVPLEEVAAGAHDEYVTSYLSQLAAACPESDVILRFAHEMELRPSDDSTWYSWQDQAPETYRKAWAHMVELGRRTNPHVRWLWSPNHADEVSAPYYPGDELVDYVGVTLNLPASKRAQYADFADYYARKGVGEHLERYGKPLFISEVACAGDDPAAKLAYLQSIVDFVGANRKICAAVFFNDDKDADRTYRITDNEDYMGVLYEGIRRYAAEAK